MLIELRYQCYIHACSGNYLGIIFLLYFPLFFRFFVCVCVCVFILYVRTVILVVRTIRLFRPDAHGSCPNGRVFAISYVAPRLDVTYVPSGR